MCRHQMLVSRTICISAIGESEEYYYAKFCQYSMQSKALFLFDPKGLENDGRKIGELSTFLGDPKSL